MNNNVIGRMTCPICGEPLQDLKVNINHKLYMFCDNGCTVKLNSAKSKRYLPVLIAGSDVNDESFGVIISTCKGNKINEIIKQKEIRNAGSLAGSNDNRTGNGSSTGAGTNNRTGSRIIRRADGSDSGSSSNRTGDQSIIGRAAAWLAADDDDE